MNFLFFLLGLITGSVLATFFLCVIIGGSK